ncbi:hypothetical protein Tco_1485823 [Tanacetum coccineum]
MWLRRNNCLNMECRVSGLRRNTLINYAITGSIPINRGLIQAIPTSLPPQPIGESRRDYGWFDNADSVLYRGEYSQWSERFMNYLEEQTDGKAMINSIRNGEHPLPVVAQVSLTGTAPNAPPTLKDPKFWTAKEKKTRKIDRLARSLLIQGLPNDIYSLIDSNDTAKDLWDALERQMRGSEYGEQDRKTAILYEYETFRATEGEQSLDTYLRYLQVINDLKKCGYKKDNCELNYKFLNNL